MLPRCAVRVQRIQRGSPKTGVEYLQAKSRLIPSVLQPRKVVAKLSGLQRYADKVYTLFFIKEHLAMTEARGVLNI